MSLGKLSPESCLILRFSALACLHPCQSKLHNPSCDSKGSGDVRKTGSCRILRLMYFLLLNVLRMVCFLLLSVESLAHLSCCLICAVLMRSTLTRSRCAGSRVL